MWCAEIDQAGNCVALLSPRPADMSRFVAIPAYDPLYFKRTYDRQTDTWSAPAQ